MPESQAVISLESIERKILFLRGQKVMLSRDLASLYEVEPKVLIQAVKRNIERFPQDFMFQLTNQEVSALKSQSVTLNVARSPRANPYAFTEQGIAMLSSVLQSRKAILVHVEIIRAFVRLRQLLASHKDLARKLEELESKYDTQFKIVFDAIRELIKQPPSKSRKIGFTPTGG